MRYAISILLLPVLFLIGCTAVASDNNGAVSETPVSETAVSETAAPETSADPAQLQNSWLLIELNGRAPLTDREITLNIAADSLGGNGGCNSYGGSYELVDGRLLISDIFSTMMACLEEGVMEQEAAYFEALNSAVAFELTDNGQTLLLQNARGETILRYTLILPEANAELEGSLWSLTTIIANESASSLLAGSAVTLAFDIEASLISGTAGCNNYSAAYSMDGDKLDIGPAAATRMFCDEPEGLMAQESQFLTWLEEVEGYAVDGRQLTLILSDGRSLLFTLQ
jgi:heat shock protein HslJ